MSNALVEAMAAGLVCIANDIPPNREVLDQGRVGYLVPVGDEEALISQLRQLVTGNSPASDLGLSAAARAKEEYGIGTVAAKCISAYKAFLAGRE
ncbi:Glycosyl transferases group 1 [compost metagenome]